MSKPFLFLAALVAGAVLSGVCAPCLLAQGTPAAPAPAAEFKIPPEAVNRVNPVKATPESMTRAKKVYGYECAVCHGDAGDGAGDMAKNLKTKMPDFRDPSSLKGRTDGELFYIIDKGKGEMEGEGQRLKPDDDWSLVNYIRSFAKLQAAMGPAPH